MNIDQLRKLMDLPEIVPGEVVCLMCDKPFQSWDKKRNRRCPTCQERLEMQQDTEPEELYWDHIDSLYIELDEDYVDFVHDCPDLLEKV